VSTPPGGTSRNVRALEAVPAGAFDELLALYRDLDDHLARVGVKCRVCGRCCDFARNDYRLYASFLEFALVARGHGQPRLGPSGCCGFLVEGSCSIHPVRPLGCRTFFCDRAHKPREQDTCHAFQQRLRALTDRHGLAWDYSPFFGRVH
jgi:Fe-S-cluster containining protein